MVLELGVRSPPPKAPQATTARIQSAIPASSGTPFASLPAEALRNPRYSIRVNGCTPETYKEAEQRLFETLLGSQTAVIHEHHRQTPASLGVLKRMKPIWTSGTECYGWVSDDLLHTATLEQYAGVFVDEGPGLGDESVTSEFEVIS